VRQAAGGGDSKRIRVALDRPALSLTPGQPAVFSITLNNGGRTVDHYSIEVEGVPEGWVKAPPQAPQLNPGQRATVPLTVSVPRNSDSLAGEYPVTIRARSRENPGEAGSALASWTVLPFAQSLLTLTPSRVRAWRKAQIRATLRNQGNAAARYSLTGADEEQGSAGTSATPRFRSTRAERHRQAPGTAPPASSARRRTGRSRCGRRRRGPRPGTWRPSRPWWRRGSSCTARSFPPGCRRCWCWPRSPPGCC
jgi:hypothetical protein